MKTVARVILVLLGLLFVGGALFLAALNYNLIPGLAVSVYLPGWAGDNALLIGAVILLLIALVFISLGLRSSKKVGNAVLKGSEFGEVLISISAVENMISRVVQQKEGLKDIGRKVSFVNEGLLVKVRVQVLPDVAIPGLVTELQQQIKEYLEEMTGVAVHEVKVMVENVATEQPAAKK